MEYDHDATYSPEDNKLRIFPAYRFDTDDYNKLRSAGFRWAPKQELFVAPMWTPEREDICSEYCGEIGDEDTSMEERAEVRADRFDGYKENRAKDAETAKEGVKALTDHIPLGQPILVGHHSEKRARRDAKRIEDGMRKAVKMWETSEYWQRRAKGVMRNANYKAQPEVRARRIKKLEAGKRKQEKIKTTSQAFIDLWTNPEKELTLQRAMAITNHSYFSMCFTLEEYPREPPVSQYEGEKGLWSALDDGIINAEQAKDLHLPGLTRSMAGCDRWINHYTLRIEYEKTLLGEQGASDLLAPKKRPKQPPLLNYRAPEGIQVENLYHRGEFSLYPQIEMTRAEYAKVYRDNKGTALIENSHRVRIRYRMSIGSLSSSVVFLTDSKEHKRPEPADEANVLMKPEPEKTATGRELSKPAIQNIPLKTVKTALFPDPITIADHHFGNEFEAMKGVLRDGIKTVVAPHLHPTPPDIAARMVELLQAGPGMAILEPSAGTGPLLKALPNVRPGGRVVAVEINQALAQGLKGIADEVINDDFLNRNGDLIKFDRIIMNPPFNNGQDIKHINHALTFLKPGGRLVALCGNGSRQQAAFKNDIVELWQELPAGSFKHSGTMVNVAMLVIDKP